MIGHSLKTTYAPTSYFASTGPDESLAPLQSEVDEVVFNEKTGTFAGFQEAPNLAELLKSKSGACSFIV